MALAKDHGLGRRAAVEVGFLEMVARRLGVFGKQFIMSLKEKLEGNKQKGGTHLRQLNARRLTIGSPRNRPG